MPQVKTLLKFALVACIAAMFIAPTASAAFKPYGFTAHAVHGNFAWGKFNLSGDYARVNLHSGGISRFTFPWQFSSDGIAYDAVATDTAVAGLLFGGDDERTLRLVRYDVRSGLHVLDTIFQSATYCNDYFKPLSLEEDGTLTAVRFGVVVSPGGICRLDAQSTRIMRYVPGRATPERVRLPSKYQPWLDGDRLDANENTLAIGRRSRSDRPGTVVALDMRSGKILARVRTTKVERVALANPRSLYIWADGPHSYGRVSYLRIGSGKPRTLLRGMFGGGFSVNCGNRALVIDGRTLELISRAGKVVLTRRIKPGHFFTDVTCSTNYLSFRDIGKDTDYNSSNPWLRHVVNISKLP
jgi:hypothetical protein